MDLVTVTSMKEHQQMILQAESLDKFVKPCTHWVVINDIDPDLEFWSKNLSKYYTNHTLKLITFNDHEHFSTYVHQGGYYSQQVFKLLISKYITGKYLIIDTKSFFVEETNLEDYEDQIGNGQIHDYAKDYRQNVLPSTIKMYARALNTLIDYKHLDCFCPFVVDTEILRSVNNLDELLNWFINLNSKHICEYLLYSTIFQKNKKIVKQKLKNRISSNYIWPGELFSSFSNEDFKKHRLLGLHYEWLRTCSDDELELANKYIKNIGFTNILSRPKDAR